ncbi:hypothetical protein Rs2_39708 [Raphanus sativus]|nr:hypothetical protein Rs2_39708 [Raphanus sativus]
MVNNGEHLFRDGWTLEKTRDTDLFCRCGEVVVLVLRRLCVSTLEMFSTLFRRCLDVKTCGSGFLFGGVRYNLFADACRSPASIGMWSCLFSVVGGLVGLPLSLSSHVLGCTRGDPKSELCTFRIGFCELVLHCPQLRPVTVAALGLVN